MDNWSAPTSSCVALRTIYLHVLVTTVLLYFTSSCTLGCPRCSTLVRTRKTRSVMFK